MREGSAMNSAMNDDKRTARRYYLLTPMQATIAGVEADIIDLSTGGARLQMTSSVVPGAHLPVTIPVAGATISVLARVLWCDLAALSLDDEESDRYQCGIEFQAAPAILRHVINDLVSEQAAIAIEDVRRSQRYRVTANLAAVITSWPSARVLDISVKGARIGTAAPMAPGTKAPMRFTLNGTVMPVDVHALVVWSRPAERKGRYEAGLMIDGSEEWLQAVIEELSLRGGAVLELNTLRRKFDPIASRQMPGLVGISR
jgi:hypothetical protein